jgi:hypothetical protein
MNNKSTLTFKTPIPQKTGKTFRYPYEGKLAVGIVKYFKKNISNWKRTVGLQKIKFFETYEGGIIYLNSRFDIYNHKNEHKEIEL